MNSRAGMSTPVESISTVTTMAGLGRLRNSRMRCKGRSTVGLPVIFCTNESPRPNTSRQRFDELVGVGDVRQVVGGEDQRLGEPAGALLRAPGRTS